MNNNEQMKRSRFQQHQYNRLGYFPGYAGEAASRTVHYTAPKDNIHAEYNVHQAPLDLSNAETMS